MESDKRSEQTAGNKNVGKSVTERLEKQQFAHDDAMLSIDLEEIHKSERS